MVITCRVVGLESLKKRLQQDVPLALELTSNEVVKDAGNLLRDEMKRRVPVYSGPLADLCPPGFLKNAIASYVTHKSTKDIKLGNHMGVIAVCGVDVHQKYPAHEIQSAYGVKKNKKKKKFDADKGDLHVGDSGTRAGMWVNMVAIWLEFGTHKRLKYFDEESGKTKREKKHEGTGGGIKAHTFGLSSWVACYSRMEDMIKERITKSLQRALS